MRTSIESESIEFVNYCDRCENNGVTAIVFCDECPSTCCVHLSGMVGDCLWCIHCIKRAGLSPEILFRWYMIEAPNA